MAADSKNHKRLIVDQDMAPQRVDNFLFNHFKGVPKSRLYRALRRGEVRVNGKKILPTYRLQSGDEILLPTLKVGEVRQASVLSPERLAKIRDQVIFEDDQIIILNKPAGMAVHGGSGVDLGVIEMLRQWQDNPKLALCHRIDKETSGCLVIAKKNIILKELHDLFREKLVKKTYLAVVEGHWPKRIAKIDAALIKQRAVSGERFAKVSADGKPATTLVRVLKSGRNASLLEVRPQTGRMHQIRVHLAHMGHPIVGDRKYGRRSNERPKRLLLHAAGIQFKYNKLDKEINICSCLDNDFISEIRRLTE